MYFWFLFLVNQYLFQSSRVLPLLLKKEKKPELLNEAIFKSELPVTANPAEDEVVQLAGAHQAISPY